LFGKFLKGFSGAVVDGLSQGRALMDAYATFYVGAGAICVPALLLCFFLAARQARSKEQPAAAQLISAPATDRTQPSPPA
jgi:PAT family beta-lactamase induction signal transducer AmpG